MSPVLTNLQTKYCVSYTSKERTKRSHWKHM